MKNFRLMLIIVVALTLNISTTATNVFPAQTDAELPLQAEPVEPFLSEETACGNLEIKYSVKTDKKKRPAPSPEPGQALVYVLSPNAIQNQLAMDGIWMGAIQGKNYFYFSAAPGERQFCSQAVAPKSYQIVAGKERSLLGLTLEPGNTYFLHQKLSVKTTLGGLFPLGMTHELVLLTEEEGMKMLKKLNLSVFTEKR